MPSIAILIANARYDELEDLPCCIEDAKAINCLLKATGRFDVIKNVTEVSGDDMRAAIRETLNEGEKYDEIFFYFSGHGTHLKGEFYFCGNGFSSSRPNETGLSHTQLLAMFRNSGPKLLTKVIDACSSGTLLIKSDVEFIPLKKDGLQSVIQLSSSLVDQSSFGGNPLSKFTETLCKAILRRESGPIYYSDIINVLRDEYVSNDEQTPYFVAQGTGRELLIEDAKALEPFRTAFHQQWSGAHDGETDVEEDGESSVVAVHNLTPLELLEANEKRLGGPDEAADLTDRLFDGIPKQFDSGKFGDFFEVELNEYSSYQEQPAEDFMIRILSKENLGDKLVTAESRRVKKKPRNYLDRLSAMTNSFAFLDEEWTDQFDLELNCTLERAQLCITLRPKYRSLQQMKLVLSIAPSFERCYVFELLTKHPYTDWDSFDDEGEELVRRWFKVDWDEDPAWVADKICSALEDAIQKHIGNVSERLSER